MEDILDVYQEAFDERRPLINMDEASRQVLSDVTPPLPMKPGAPLRIDDKYERGEVRSLFMFYNPITGWRRVGCRESRTRFDWAEEVRRLLDEDYPHAELATLVCDNLNTHDTAGGPLSPADPGRALDRAGQREYRRPHGQRDRSVPVIAAVAPSSVLN